MQPTSLVVSQGETGTFVCEVLGVGGWRINETTVVSSNLASFQSRGFTAAANESVDSEYRIITSLTMVAVGYARNNNTTFVCYSVSDEGAASVSSTAHFFISGELVLNSIIHNAIFISDATIPSLLPPSSPPPPT